MDEQCLEKSIDDLEGGDSRETERSDSTPLVRECRELRKMPLRELNGADTRLRLGQRIGTRWVARLAMDELDDDPLLAASFYAGDLLLYLLRLPESFWKRNWEIKEQLADIFARAVSELDASDEAIPAEKCQEIRETGGLLFEQSCRCYQN
jgi:hypothetical protein